MNQDSLRPHRGGLVLVLGILGIVLCQILAPFAWVMGNNDLAAMNAGTMDSSGRGLTDAGRICGIIGTILLGLSLLGGIAFVIFAFFVGSMSMH